MNPPRIYSAIAAVSADLARSGIPKRQANQGDGYLYRSIDDVYNRLSPLLAKHKLCILPRILERECTQRRGTAGELLLNVSVKIAYDLVSADDGSSHTIECYGEALDSGDKATSKALTAAYKYAVLHTFCIPVGGVHDADTFRPKLAREGHVMEPVQGWQQWTTDIAEMLGVCETLEAVDRVQNSNRGLLTGLRAEQPDLYAALGRAIAGRRKALLAPPPKSSGKKSSGQTCAAARKTMKGARNGVTAFPTAN